EWGEAGGRRVGAVLVARGARVEGFTRVIEAHAHAAAGEYAQRLRQRVAELLREVPVDEARLATEIAIFAERVDVSEEVTRLRSQLVQFREDVTHATGAVGRRLEIVLQEMGREAN